MRICAARGPEGLATAFGGDDQPRKITRPNPAALLCLAGRMKLLVPLRRLFWLALPFFLRADDAVPPATTTNLPPLPPPSLKRPVQVRTNRPAGGTNAVRVLPATNQSNYRPTIHVAPPPGVPPVVNNPGAFAWDAMLKEYHAKAGETEAKFNFALTNVSKGTVTIDSVHTSCGCTVAKLPQTPWALAPGDHGEIGVTVDLHGKFGTISKTATIYSSVGTIPLTVRIVIPPAEASARMSDRTRNLQVAAADRQAVFRGDCATCHVAPAVGKTGKALYDAACAVCHEGQNRATMVPDLRALTKPTDAAYWTQWITAGREGSLMPAFALAQHGILNDAQIKSLVDYLGGEFHLEVKLPGEAAPK